MTSVIFDLEGTLVDFQWDLDRGERQARATLVEMGFPEEPFADRTYAEIWNTAVAEAEKFGHSQRDVRQRLGQVYDTCDLDALDRWTVRPGAEALVQSIAETALVTNIGRQAVDRFQDSYGFEFDEIVTRTDVRYIKPDPTGIERAATNLEGDVLFVGDSATDLKACRRADVPVAIVQGSEGNRPAVGDHRPTHVLREISEVRSLL